MNGRDRTLPELAGIAADLAAKAGIPELASGAVLRSITDGGSERLFMRLIGGGRTAVLLYEPRGGRELDSYVDLALFLGRSGIGVPELYAVDRDRSAVLMEDLGDTHLDDALGALPPAEAPPLYRAALAILVELQTSVTETMLRENLLEERLFDEETLLGETDYFMREFIGRFCPVSIPASWAHERRFLAETLARERRCFMHRDFQSRNIMVKEGRLRVIDFQTAHRGPGVYDAASLLKDPYHPLPAASRRVLLEELHAELLSRGARREEPFEVFYETFTLAGIQRNLQALAAFAKLGGREGKKRFLESIPAALDLLEEGVTESGRFPALGRIVASVRGRLGGCANEGSP
jgi:aminoglycoside/choline kinase family phosphotransferase